MGEFGLGELWTYTEREFKVTLPEVTMENNKINAA